MKLCSKERNARQRPERSAVLLRQLMVVISVLVSACAHHNLPSDNDIQRITQQATAVRNQDQHIRSQLQHYLQLHLEQHPLSDSSNSAAVKELWQQQQALDERNRRWAAEVLNTWGWPSKKRFDDVVARSLFLVIQHADVEFQQRFFPLVEQAVHKGDLDRPALALLTDRMLVNQGKPQRYGTQLQKEGDAALQFYPIEQPEQVDRRRATMGLGTLHEYADQLGIIWQPSNTEIE
ncbi:hypothetical protein CHH28_17485 [Bacterioplanes sanyensis]|uniref:Uncharacterized protein n=1 Tax=Bacterioplanes sanyensis TaxID=1249553 RepID=A0A222FMV5_9GAMM|nr:DUF6624 domain-containing protein [Bacterioplanes sanyensis]ASP40358.1 hypothetical protein CHH28_17485 [Bacterioplanes sanyensis]